MKTLLAILTLAFVAPANACTDPCLNQYINMKTGQIFLAESKPKHSKPYTWTGWDDYGNAVKRKRGGK